MKLWQRPPAAAGSSSRRRNFRDWRDRATSFERMAAFDPHSANLVGAGEPLRLDGARVSGDLFALLGVPPLIGRSIEPDDDREAAAPTVMISERLWRTRFGGRSARRSARRSASTISRRIIVGVMPRTFEFPKRAADFWIPFQFAPTDYVYSNPSIEAIARLKPGVSRAQAFGRDAADRARRLARRRSATSTSAIGASVIALRDEISPQSRLLLWCLRRRRPRACC